MATPPRPNTGEVPLYDVLMHQVGQLREDLKDLEKKVETHVRDIDCRGHLKDVFAKIRDTRSAINNIEAGLEIRVKSVEVAQKEASTMTQTQVESAVQSGIVKANGTLEAAVVRGVKQASGHLSFWPKTLREALQTTLFTFALLGMGYTAFDYLANRRVEAATQAKLLQQVQQIVHQQNVKQIHPTPPLSPP